MPFGLRVRVPPRPPYMEIIDILTYLAYFALVGDLIIENLRIIRRKSSDDISIVGTSIRGVAILIILYKLTTVGDVPVLVGHSMITVAFVLYLVLVIIYHAKKSKKA